MAGKRQKHPDRLAFTRGGRGARLQPIGPRRVAPQCPKAVSAEARRMWSQLWQSNLSATIGDSDLPALYRWLWWYDEWIETAAVIRRVATMVASSPGERVVKAKTRYLHQCELNLQKLEEALGMTPVARMRLGIVSGARRPAHPRVLAYDRSEDPRRLLRSVAEGGLS